jgi:TonB family protein
LAAATQGRSQPRPHDRDIHPAGSTRSGRVGSAHLTLGAALLLSLGAQGLAPPPVHAAEPAPATAQAPVAAPQVRVDGLYHSRDPQRRGDSFLRFYPDGSVLVVASTGSPIQVLKWLVPGAAQAGKGQYRIDGDALAFEETSTSGRVDYAGTIAGTTLDLQVTSRINGHQSRRQYVFVPDDSSTFGPTDPVAIDMAPAPYPKGAATSEGTVVLLVDIATSGAVTSATVEKSSGVETLDTAALQAARKWSFRAARDAKGQPVPARMRAPMTFKPGANLGEDIPALMATSCRQVNDEVARLDPATAGKSAGTTIDRGMSLVMMKQTTPALVVVFPQFEQVPSLADGRFLAFMTNLTATAEALKAQCAAQPDVLFGAVLQQQIQALPTSSRRTKR